MSKYRYLEVFQSPFDFEITIVLGSVGALTSFNSFEITRICSVRMWSSTSPLTYLTKLSWNKVEGSMANWSRGEREPQKLEHDGPYHCKIRGPTFWNGMHAIKVESKFALSTMHTGLICSKPYEAVSWGDVKIFILKYRKYLDFSVFFFFFFFFY